MSRRNGKHAEQVLGVLEWFEIGEHDRVERVLAELGELGVRHLRTGISWAGWHTDGGAEWYDWLLPRLARDVEVLPCVTYTPPSLGLAPRSSAPPRRPRDYADFLDVLISRHGEHFTDVELWNEPNSRAEWDYTLDPEWTLFAEMIGDASYWARERGKRVVLGGMSPVDPGWLDLLGRRGVLAHLDVVGIHGFPGTWEAGWDGWGATVARVREVLERHGSRADVWITEVGYSTWQDDELGQVRTLVDALDAPVSRVYWYAAEDLDPERPAIDRFHEDEREYHFGLCRADGRPKLLHRLWATGGIAAVRETARLAEKPPRRPTRKRHALVTGGAGFVGTNLAHRLLSDGRPVVVYDNLSRPGVETNVRWLREQHGDLVTFEIADVRNPFRLRSALARADRVFHLAAQVAVTTSLDTPRDDFGVNLLGTVTLLEELRRLADPPPLLFTSTNKVYGALPELELERVDDRWAPVDEHIRAHGLDESVPLDFCTPYGCSKGGADQYVLDYAKSYGLPAVVFRMSCIYGPHQHGNEDQGWVAHFLIRLLEDEPITLYGDGAQVRDILFVEDLVRAMLVAHERVGELGGQAFNMGGGPDNAVSLLEVLDLLGDLHGARADVRFAEERQGDQRYYVADTGRFREATGWRPRVGVADGVEQLYRWLAKRRVGVTRPLPAVAR